MAGEFRQRSSGALIFPPTQSDRRFISEQRQLEIDKEDVRKMKKELEGLISEVKGLDNNLTKE